MQASNSSHVMHIFHSNSKSLKGRKRTTENQPRIDKIRNYWNYSFNLCKKLKVFQLSVKNLTFLPGIDTETLVIMLTEKILVMDE